MSNEIAALSKAGLGATLNDAIEGSRDLGSTDAVGTTLLTRSSSIAPVNSPDPRCNG